MDEPWLVSLDKQVTKVVHYDWDFAWLDATCVLSREAYTWIPVYLAIIGYALYAKKWHGLVIIGLILLGFAVTDSISAQVFKPLFQRLRPCNDPTMAHYIRGIVRCGSGFSMPSNHAGNHAMLSVLLIALFRPKTWLSVVLCFWASWVLFSQLHVGVHYLSDLVVGAIWGTTVSLFLARLYWKTRLNQLWR
jgi:membrane-associated phospholipid phosphatase